MAELIGIVTDAVLNLVMHEAVVIYVVGVKGVVLLPMSDANIPADD